MPIISQIGRKHPGVRVLVALIYAVLIAGAATMIYPFLLMASGSMKSAVDSRTLDVVPAFLRDDTILYRKHIEGLFNESLDALRSAHDIETISFETLEPPPSPNMRWVDEWRRFLSSSSLPAYARACGYIATPVSRTVPSGLRGFRRFAMARTGRSIGEANRAWGTEFVSWNAVFILPENYLQRVRMPPTGAFGRALDEFKAEQSSGDLYCLLPEAFYRRQYLRALYSRDIAEYNRAHGAVHADYSDVLLPQRVPREPGLERDDWERFVRHTLNVLWIRVDAAAAGDYRRFLQAKYGNIGVLNLRYGSEFPSFADIPLIEEAPFDGLALSDWVSWIEGWRDPQTGTEHRVPAEHLRVHGVENIFREHLKREYGDIEAVNARFGTDFASWARVMPPQREAHYTDFLARRAALRREFATRNFRTVTDYIVVHGRGVLNTAIYCSLSVLFALLVNPLAAYALSRYRMKSNYKILLFLMLTMAFPPMVTQIPVFLMLRQFRLLNTFAALILPALANGYSIFLLKGFFDSLPRELYENAQLDGAGEWTMFWRITMALSKPILAVIALQAFTMAYANFMYALLICQDERMWTLMVWLYQLQERSGPGVIHASLLIAAIPTFAVFVLCQKIILRGIVVPVER